MCEHILKKRRWHGLNIWTVHDVNMVLDLSILTLKNQSKMQYSTIWYSSERNRKKKSCTVEYRWFCLTQSSTCTYHTTIVKPLQDLMTRFSLRPCPSAFGWMELHNIYYYFVKGLRGWSNKPLAGSWTQSKLHIVLLLHPNKSQVMTFAFSLRKKERNYCLQTWTYGTNF